MRKVPDNRKKQARDGLKKNVDAWIPPELIIPNRYFADLARSPIHVIFPYGGVSADDYFDDSKHPMGSPWRLIDALDKSNWITFKINLNHTRTRILEDFSKLLTLVSKDCNHHGRKIKKVSDREFDLYRKVYERKQQGWTFEKIAKEIYPRDFKFNVKKDTMNFESGIKKTQSLYREARKLIEGR